MSSLDQDSGVARELADEQRQASIAEFFEKNKQMLGFGSKNRALVTAVKEGVDNSLDAAEEARILPDITVNVERNENFYTITVEDNGPGIPEDSVPNVFGKLLYGSRFHREMQQRGQQGIGISAAVLYSQLTSGNPARVLSKTEEAETATYFEIGIDTSNNQPKIHTKEDRDWSEKEHGIRIALDMEANMRARKRLHRYIKNTAVANPHATIELYEPEAELVFDERPVNELPDEVEEIKPHPHGVELGTLIDMLSATNSTTLQQFLQTEFTRVGKKTAQSIIDRFKDLQYGRSLGILVETDDDVGREEYITAVTEAVNRKGKEQTELFADQIFGNLTDMGRVGDEDLRTAVSNAAETATSKTDKTFGKTVQDRAIKAVRDVIRQNVEETVHTVVFEVTVDRKPNELLEALSNRLSEKFRDSDSLTVSRDELTDMISESAEYGESQYGGSGSFGETAQQKVFDDIWESSSATDADLPSLSKVADDRDVARRLLTGMRESDAIAPPKKCISPITEEHVMKGLNSRYDADFYTASTRDAGVANGKPFVVEAGIAYGGQIDSDGKIELNRFANRVPLVYQEGACAITKQVKSIRWNNYYKGSDELSQNSGSLPQGPMVLMIHIASTNVPFTSESKDAVADVPEMEQEIERAVREVARDLKDHLKEERTRQKRKEKRDVIGGLLSDMTDKIENITGEEIQSKTESQAKILNNVFVRTTGRKTVRMTNYGAKNQTVEVEIQTEDGTRKRTRTLKPNESKSVTVPAEVEQYTVQKPTVARVTVDSSGSATRTL